MNIFSANLDLFDDIRRVGYRTGSWWGWAGIPRSDRLMINVEEMIRRDKENPVPDDRQIVLDIEHSHRASYQRVLRDVKIAVDYYRDRYPHNRLTVYRIPPFFRYWPFVHYSNGLITDQFRALYDHSFSVNAQDIATSCDFLTIRGYIQYESRVEEYFEMMKDYIDVARQYDKQLFVFITPSFMNTRAEIPGDLWSRLLETARDEWAVESAIVLLRPNIPSDVEPGTEWRNETRRFIDESLVLS